MPLPSPLPSPLSPSPSPLPHHPLRFASPFMKERFLGRVRAMQRKFKGFGSDHEEELPLPSGETLNVLTATWNVGEKGPPDLTQLNDWLPAGEHDVYSIGFQECDKKRKWFKALQDHLCGEGARNRLKSRLQAADKMRNMMERTNGYNSQASTNCEFVLLSVQSLWGIHLVTIVRSDLKVSVAGSSAPTLSTPPSLARTPSLFSSHPLPRPASPTCPPPPKPPASLTSSATKAGARPASSSTTPPPSPS